jgi:hypothetical protein
MRIKYRYLIVELIFEKKANEAAQREGITTTEIYHRCVLRRFRRGCMVRDTHRRPLCTVAAGICCDDYTGGAWRFLWHEQMRWLLDLTAGAPHAAQS